VSLIFPYAVYYAREAGMPMAEEVHVSVEEAIAQVVARMIAESRGDRLTSRVLPPGEDRRAARRQESELINEMRIFQTASEHDSL
jgi:hypothetical protein